MGFIDNSLKNLSEVWHNSVNYFSKEIRAFNASGTTPEQNLPFLTTWFFSAKLGMPRQVDILTLRTYAKSAWVQMVVMTITKQLMTTEWKIVPKNEDEDVEKYEKEIKKIETFLNQPNRNNSTFWDVWMPFIRDVLELDAGVIYKGKNVKGELVEIFASDGSRFLFDIEPISIVGRIPLRFQDSLRKTRSSTEG